MASVVDTYGVLAPGLVSNILLCVLLGLVQWVRTRQLAQTRLRQHATRAVRHVQTSYTRPIAQERLQELVDRRADSGVQSRGEVLRTSQVVLRLTPEEKKSAHQQALAHLRGTLGGGGDNNMHRMAIEEAYQRLPRLFGSVVSEAIGLLQLRGPIRGGDDGRMPATPIFADDFVV